MTAGLIDRVRHSLLTLPSRRDWMEFAAVGVILAICLGTLGFQTELLHSSLRDPVALIHITIIAFFAPSLFEELVFRGALIPDRSEQKTAVSYIIGSTLLFTAWHLVEAAFLPGAATIFVRSDFLLSATVLGLACATLRRRSGTIWTAVILHWLVAVIWLGYLGGPTFSELRG